MDHRRVYDFFSRFLPPISALQGQAASAGQGAAHIRGKPQVLKVLQEVLTDELGAVHGHIPHSGMCDNWGCKKPAALTTRRGH